MNTFRTVIPPSNFPFKISHNNKIMCLGSCFTEKIGRFISSAKFSSLINPFGIIYNPLSICKALEMILENSPIPKADLVSINNRFYHWDFHGDLSGNDKDETYNLLNEIIQTTHTFIKEADFLFLTLGSANAFQLIDENKIVANCHKYPNGKFRRIELKIDEMKIHLQKTICNLTLNNPDLKVVFTVSPVRHLRDGLVNNQLSKAKLIQTVHLLSQSNEFVYYFPSYELVMDDLRDYRFYKDDMLHLNKIGLAYIWDYFKQSFFTSQTLSKINSIEKIKRDIEHKPFHPDSELHQNFLKQLLTKINAIDIVDSLIDYSEEIALIKEQIKRLS